MKIFRDIFGRKIRLTNERLQHIENRIEMKGQQNKIAQTLLKPEYIIESNHDPDVILYYKEYRKTPVTRKFLTVIVKVTSNDAFILSSFFTDKLKAGVPIWPK